MCRSKIRLAEELAQLAKGHQKRDFFFFYQSAPHASAKMNWCLAMMGHLLAIMTPPFSMLVEE